MTADAIAAVAATNSVAVADARATATLHARSTVPSREESIRLKLCFRL
jgi:hypothetical protein